MEATSDACPSRRAGIRSTILSSAAARCRRLRPCDDRAQHAAVDQAGADAIDAHAGAGAFPGRALGQPDHRVLAGAVDRDRRRADQAGDRGGVDDAALVLLQHHRQHVLHAEEDADHVDVEHAAEGLQRISGDRLDLTLDAGIVVEDVDGAELVDRGADIVGDLVLAGDVGGDRQRLGRGRQIRDRGLQVLLPCGRRRRCARRARPAAAWSRLR